MFLIMGDAGFISSTPNPKPLNPNLENYPYLHLRTACISPGASSGDGIAGDQSGPQMLSPEYPQEYMGRICGFRV